MNMNQAGNAARRSCAWALALAVIALPAAADVTLTNWTSSDDIPLGDVGDTFSWWQTIESYEAPAGTPQLDLDQYWLNVMIDGEITGADGSPLTGPYGYTYAEYDQFEYTGNWAFELIDQNTGTGGVIETGSFTLFADWHFTDPYDPTSPFYADITGTFHADSGDYFFPGGNAPIDFDGLRFDFTGVYDVDAALLRFTMVGSPELATAVVPEPATSVLMAMAIVALMLYGRHVHIHGPQHQH